MPTKFMKEAQHWRCDVCGGDYRTRKAARFCELRPVTNKRNVKEGDVISIIKGNDIGKEARVFSTFALERSMGGKDLLHDTGVNARIMIEGKDGPVRQFHPKQYVKKFNPVLTLD